MQNAAAITAERRRSRGTGRGVEPHDKLKMDFTKLDGLVPAVIQDADSGEVLMVGFMNDTALAKTKETGFATFYSRSRQKLWTKGETSGNKLAVQQILIDCDDDTVLVKVKRMGDGNVCHTGERSCFFRELG
jgi:phosphoribosyl-AMP cyclohydrolase